MWSCLVPLLTKCQTAGCAAAVAEDNMEKHYNGNGDRRVIYGLIIISLLGAALNVRLICDSGHQNHWSNSKTIEHKKRKVPILNIKLTVYLYLSGLSFQVFKVCTGCIIIK